MSLGNKKVIIIEDDPDHAELILGELEVGGINTEVILMKDGQEVIDYFQKTVLKGLGKASSIISLIILDINLPRICGMDILDFIKNNPFYHSIPIVILSTSSDQETIRSAYEKGANGYIVKPLSYDEFVDKIRVLRKYC
jgi:two-component system response regulator